MRCADANVLDCSWGIGAKVANDSMRSAASTLAEYASKAGQADIDGYALWVMLPLCCTILCSYACTPVPTWFRFLCNFGCRTGDTAPNFAYGDLLVDDARSSISSLFLVHSCNNCFCQTLLHTRFNAVTCCVSNKHIRELIQLAMPKCLSGMLPWFADIEWCIGWSTLFM